MRNWKKALSVAAAAALAVSALAPVSVYAEEEATFKIGGIGPTTGANAVYGSAVMNSAQIAVDEIRRRKRLHARVQPAGR